MKYLIWIFIILLVTIRYFTSRPAYKNGDRLKITSIVYSEPINYSMSQYFKIAGLKVYLPKDVEVNFGDKIIIEGVVQNGKLEKSKLISVSEGSALSKFHNKIISFYQSVLPEPYAGLLGGITLGAKGGLTSDFWEKVKKTGVAHVVVASGMNVTFAVSFFMGTATIFFSRKKAIIFVVLGIILYLFISGFEAPLVRAAIMSVIAFTAQEFGRLVNPWRILFLTIGIMLLIVPDWITDTGFILSFVATASLMLFEKRFEYWLKFIPKVFKQDFSTSLAAQVGVAPILFVTFGQFNILSPIINALVLWVVAPLMIVGSVGGIVGLVFPAFGKLMLWLGFPLLWWFVKIVQIFS